VKAFNFAITIFCVGVMTLLHIHATSRHIIIYLSITFHGRYKVVVESYPRIPQLSPNEILWFQSNINTYQMYTMAN